MLSTQDEFDASFDKYAKKKKVDLSYEEYDPKEDKVKVAGATESSKVVREDSVEKTSEPVGAVTEEFDIEDLLMEDFKEEKVTSAAAAAKTKPQKTSKKRMTQEVKPARTKKRPSERKPKPEKKEKRGFGAIIRDFFANAGLGEYLVIITALVILIAGGITLSMYSDSKDVEAGVEALIPIGEQLAEVGTHTDEFVENIVASFSGGQEANRVLERLDESVEITATFSSIMQDLKVKFVNKETDELITGIPFKVEVIPPSGEENMFTVTDEDKDGMIYVRDLEAGVYQVLCKSIGDVKFSTSHVDVAVKDQIEYQEINIINEAKTESEINVAEEDTAEQDIEVESKLQDTVGWVASSKTPVGDGAGFVEVDKTTITDPATVSFLSTAFNKVDGVVYNVTGQNSVTHGTGFSVSFDSAQMGLDDVAGEAIDALSWTIDGVDQGIADTVLNVVAEDFAADPGYGNTSTMVIVCNVTCSNPDKSGTATLNVTVNSAEAEPTVDSVTLNPSTNQTVEPGVGYVEIIASANYSNGSQSSEKITWARTAGDAGITFQASNGTLQVAAEADAADGATATYQATSIDDPTKTASITITVEKPVTDITVTLNKTEETIARPDTLQLTATVENETADDSVTWTSSDDEIATVDSTGKVTPVGGGTATITCTTTEKKASDGTTAATATCKVTVSPLKITLVSATAGTSSPEKIYLNTEVNLTATFTNRLADDQITWTTSDATVGTITKKTESTAQDVYTFKALKEGTVDITVYSKEGLGENKGQAVAIYRFVVEKDPTKDTTTKLVDKAGTQIYVKEGTDYREATYADYYSASKFYVKGAVEYTYTGWQTLADNNTYFFDRDGNKVTGTQVIQGVEYTFSPSGILSMGDGVIGIDVSKWNGTIDWTAVKKSGVDFVIIRCGYRGSSTGALVVDPKFEQNIAGATAAGLKVGVYFFTQAINEVEAVEEASLALALTSKYSLAYPIFIDVEGSGGRADSLDTATRTSVVNAFCQTITNAGKRAGIYANKSWLNSKLNMGTLNSYTIWLAQYNTAPTYSGKYDMWQYSDQGHVGGISGNVDMNKSYVNY